MNLFVQIAPTYTYICATYCHLLNIMCNSGDYTLLFNHDYTIFSTRFTHFLQWTLNSGQLSRRSSGAAISTTLCSLSCALSKRPWPRSFTTTLSIRRSWRPFSSCLLTLIIWPNRLARTARSVKVDSVKKSLLVDSVARARWWHVQDELQVE